MNDEFGVVPVDHFSNHDSVRVSHCFLDSHVSLMTTRVSVWCSLYCHTVFPRTRSQVDKFRIIGLANVVIMGWLHCSESLQGLPRSVCSTWEAF